MFLVCARLGVSWTSVRLCDSRPSMGGLPKKLIRDAILEALVEIRFETGQVGELVVGKLASFEEFDGYSVTRLPVSNVPADIRESDANLRIQPTIQLASPKSTELVKIGPHVISIHVMAPYPGWDVFAQRIRTVADCLCQMVRDVSIARIGLRYVNAITPHHGVAKLTDLQFSVRVGNEPVDEEMVFSRRFSSGEDISGTLSVATPSFVDGPNVPAECAAFVDIDMFTPLALGGSDPELIIDWAERAHAAEKKAFFGLFSDQQIEALAED